MAPGISTRNRATMEKSSLLLKLKACAGQRVTLFERLDWKTPCLMHTLVNQLRSSQKDTWAFYASVDSFSLAKIKSWHNSFLKSAWRDHTRCSVQIVTKSTLLLGTVVGWKYIHTRIEFSMLHRHLIFSFIYLYIRQVPLLLMICIYV